MILNKIIKYIHFLLFNKYKYYVIINDRKIKIEKSNLEMLFKLKYFYLGYNYDPLGYINDFCYHLDINQFDKLNIDDFVYLIHNDFINLKYDLKSHMNYYESNDDYSKLLLTKYKKFLYYNISDYIIHLNKNNKEFLIEFINIDSVFNNLEVFVKNNLDYVILPRLESVIDILFHKYSKSNIYNKTKLLNYLGHNYNKKYGKIYYFNKFITDLKKNKNIFKLKNKNINHSKSIIQSHLI